MNKSIQADELILMATPEQIEDAHIEAHIEAREEFEDQQEEGVR